MEQSVPSGLIQKDRDSPGDVSQEQWSESHRVTSAQHQGLAEIPAGPG